jgi:hypothetical protein
MDAQNDLRTSQETSTRARLRFYAMVAGRPKLGTIETRAEGGCQRGKIASLSSRNHRSLRSRQARPHLGGPATLEARAKIIVCDAPKIARHHASIANDKGIKEGFVPIGTREP